MKELNIQIPEGHEIDTDNSDLSKGEVVFKVKPGLPDRWEDLGEIGGYYISGLAARGDSQLGQSKRVFATKELAKASIAIAQLSQLRAKAWGDWRPDWAGQEEVKHVIYFDSGEITRGQRWGVEYFLAFPTPELRNEFLEKYRDLIEQARPILGGGV